MIYTISSFFGGMNVSARKRDHKSFPAYQISEHRAGSLGLLLGAFGGSGMGLHHLTHEVSHGFRCLVLHLPGGVGVGAECESGVVVAQHAGDRLHVYAVLERQSRESVPEVVEANVLQPCILQDLFMELDHGVRVVHLLGHR